MAFGNDVFVGFADGVSVSNLVGIGVEVGLTVGDGIAVFAVSSAIPTMAGTEDFSCVLDSRIQAGSAQPNKKNAENQ